MFKYTSRSYKIFLVNFQKLKQIDLDILKFREKYQTPDTRREFDINNPLECKTSLPNRVDDNDPRITVSSGQR